VIDLNLIRAFVTIYETGSVSAAAERLHVSQPSISYTLKRLRDLLEELLFKRTRDGMAPTYFATQLYEKFRIAISEIEGAIENTRKFDPYLSSRRFRLAMSDLGEIYLLPHLMAALQKIAPDLGFDIVAVEVTKLEEWLNAGKIDAAVCNRGYVPVDSAGEVIFTDHYVCLASSRHPRLSSELTMQQYLAERHVLVDPETGHSVVEELTARTRLHSQDRAARAAFQRAAGGYCDHGSLAHGSVEWGPQVCSSAFRPSFRSAFHGPQTRNHAAVARA
jgi:DNA-binding transcriptional LysR family regulator